MKVIIELSQPSELEPVLKLLKSLEIEGFSVQKSDSTPSSSLTPGDKTVALEDLFGMWKDDPRDLDGIRAKAWKRDWNRA